MRQTNERKKVKQESNFGLRQRSKKSFKETTLIESSDSSDVSQIKITEDKNGYSSSSSDVDFTEKRKKRKNQVQLQIDNVLDNENYCFICKCNLIKFKEGGTMVCCDACEKSYHQKCIYLKEIPEGFWECPVCVTNKLKCTSCSQPIKGLKVLCSICYRNTHYDCIQIPIELILDSILNKQMIWNDKINECIDQIKQNIDYQESKKQLDILLADKDIFYICNPCITRNNIDKIHDEIKLRDKNYFFYQPKCKQYKFIDTQVIHSIWIGDEQLRQLNAIKVKNFKQRNEVSEIISDYQQQFVSFSATQNQLWERCKVERIIGCKANKYVEKISGDRKVNYGQKYNLKFYIKWEQCPYDQCSYEDEKYVQNYQKQLNEYIEINERINNKENPQKGKVNLINKQPNYLNGHLLDFQLKGLEFLINNYVCQNNVILADEMGLGKTIQVLSFVQYLLSQLQISKPILVIAPSSILFNWQKEANLWLPKSNTIVYFGSEQSRNIIKQKEFYFHNQKIKFNLLITSYEIALKDVHHLKKINWETIVIDEAHRLKNNQCQLFKAIVSIKSHYKILVTGTPLQNNINELISLIEFLNPERCQKLKKNNRLQRLFQNELELQDQGEIQKATKILVNELQGQMLRRSKDDVDIHLPALKEVILKIKLSQEQIQLYKNLLVKNYKYLHNKYGNKHSFLNLIMHLRLVCNHPALLYDKQLNLIPENFQEEFINNSNKLKILERLIEELREKQCKVLVFSQFKMMLDVIEQMLKFRGWNFNRLDGNTNIIQKQVQIDNFNEDESCLIFLLSTRAGGYGINLTSANTIIFVDNDFNPFKDLQAISRAHRMGQKQKIKVIRLVSLHTVEEKIIEIAQKKLFLEQLIINPLNKMSKKELDDVIKGSTAQLFNENYLNDQQEFSQKQIQELISRDFDDEISIKQSKSSFLSSFKYTSFQYQTEEKQQIQNDQFWDNVMNEDDQNYQHEEGLGKGQRTKNKLQNVIVKKSNKIEQPRNGQNSDCSFSIDSVDLENTNNSQTFNDQNQFQKTKIPKYKLAYIDKIAKKILYIEKVKLDFKQILQNKSLNQINESQINLKYDLLDFCLNYGCNFDSIDDIFKNFCNFKKINHNFRDFKIHLLLFYSNSYQNEVFDTVLNSKNEDIYAQIQGLNILKSIYKKHIKKPLQFNIKHKLYQPNIAKELQCNEWTNFDDFILCKGIFKYGFNQIEDVINDNQLWNLNQYYESWKYLVNKFDSNWITYDPSISFQYLKQSIITQAQNLMYLSLMSEEEYYLEVIQVPIDQN